MSERADKILKNFKENRVYMEERVQNGIETNRKGVAKFFFVTKDGKPIENVKVKISQTTHDFKFGANIFLLEELENEEKNRLYKEHFAQVFNLATLPFYWSDLEPEKGKTRFEKDSPKIYRRPAPDLCLEYCEANNIEPKLHCLNYDKFTPLWVSEDVPTVKKYLDKRMKEIAERYAEKIPSMEVINETLCNEVNLDSRHSTQFFREPDIVEWSFEQARKYFPKNKLIINEDTPHTWGAGFFKYNRSAYYMQIERALSKGATIDSIGMQFHTFFARESYEERTEFLYNPLNLFKVMDQYSDFNRPLQVTEITIPSYSWEEEDEQIQAEIISNLYKIWFSHSNMEAIIYWNLVDGYAYGKQGDMTSDENKCYGGLFRYDLSPKPAFYVLDELINKTWRTNISDEVRNGSYEMKGFYGKYEVCATVSGKTTVTEIHLKKDTDNEFKIVL